jgi:hypothetical protein
MSNLINLIDVPAFFGDALDDKNLSLPNTDNTTNDNKYQWLIFDQICASIHNSHNIQEKMIVIDGRDGIGKKHLDNAVLKYLRSEGFNLKY